MLLQAHLRPGGTGRWWRCSGRPPTGPRGEGGGAGSTAASAPPAGEPMQRGQPSQTGSSSTDTFKKKLISTYVYIYLCGFVCVCVSVHLA